MHMHNGCRYTHGAMACAPHVRLSGSAARHRTKPKGGNDANSGGRGRRGRRVFRRPAGRGGRDVTFLVRDGRAAALAREGLLIRSPRGDLTLANVQTVRAGDAGPASRRSISCC